MLAANRSAQLALARQAVEQLSNRGSNAATAQ